MRNMRNSSEKMKILVEIICTFAVLDLFLFACGLDLERNINIFLSQFSQNNSSGETNNETVVVLHYAC